MTLPQPAECHPPRRVGGVFFRRQALRRLSSRGPGLLSGSVIRTLSPVARRYFMPPSRYSDVRRRRAAHQRSLTIAGLPHSFSRCGGAWGRPSPKARETTGSRRTLSMDGQPGRHRIDGRPPGCPFVAAMTLTRFLGGRAIDGFGREARLRPSMGAALAFHMGIPAAADDPRPTRLCGFDRWLHGDSRQHIVVGIPG